MTNCTLEIESAQAGAVRYRCTACEREITLPREMHVLRQCASPSSEPRDESRVGSVLKEWIAKAGYKPGRECQCNFLAAKLDGMSLEAIKAGFDQLVAQIHQSAAGQDVHVPLAVVSAALRCAVWRETKRIGKG